MVGISVKILGVCESGILMCFQGFYSGLRVCGTNGIPDSYLVIPQSHLVQYFQVTGRHGNQGTYYYILSNTYCPAYRDVTASESTSYFQVAYLFFDRTL